MKRKLKMTFGILAIIIALLVAGGILFLNFSPQFGASKKQIQTAKVLSSPNFDNGVFRNQEETPVMVGFKWSSLPEYFKSGDKMPMAPLPIKKIRTDELNQLNDSLTRITWFGHSTVLIEMTGKLIFIDPMLGNVPSPVSWAGSGRFNPELPVEIESLPFIDVVLITHDHYDHLDYGSIQKLKEKVGKFYTPLGVGAHLRAWGVEREKITEMDWWDSKSFDDITFVSTPARHFSGRGIFDRNSTLWCSWVIQSGSANIFFSGDGGYGDHFKTIGTRFGPFDFAMMECGQYNEQWPKIHMLPEEIPQALTDLKTRIFMPIHWGAFKLALHPWTDPVEKLRQSIGGTEFVMATPVIGEGFIIGHEIPTSDWWTSAK